VVSYEDEGHQEEGDNPEKDQDIKKARVEQQWDQEVGDAES